TAHGSASSAKVKIPPPNTQQHKFMPHTYQYPRAALTVDCVVFGFDEGELKVLLIERALEPFKGKWALPGGFVRVDETLDEAARRELEEEAGRKNGFLEHHFPYGAPHCVPPHPAP